MKILFLIATWQRVELTKICYYNLNLFIKANPQYEWEVFIICSEPEHEELARQHGYHYCTAPNFPVGAKMNSGLQACMQLQWDYIMQLGSDDILNPEIMQHYQPQIAAGAHIIGVHSAVYIDMAQQRAKTFCYEEGLRVIGAGRMISRQSIEASALCITILPTCQMSNGDTKIYRNTPVQLPINKAQSLINSGHATLVTGTQVINLWEPEKNRGLDASSQKTLSRAGFEPKCLQIDNMVFDVKTETNIWAFDDLPGYPVNYEQALKYISLPQNNNNV